MRPSDVRNSENNYEDLAASVAAALFAAGQLSSALAGSPLVAAHGCAWVGGPGVGQTVSLSLTTAKDQVAVAPKTTAKDQVAVAPKTAPEKKLVPLPQSEIPPHLRRQPKSPETAAEDQLVVAPEAAAEDQRAVASETAAEDQRAVASETATEDLVRVTPKTAPENELVPLPQSEIPPHLRRQPKPGWRSFQLIAGSSRKFWRVKVEGRGLTVEFGRIGSKGQRKTKSFTAPKVARREAEKLVRSKVKKGYTEVEDGPR